MKKLLWMPVLYALGGATLLLVLAAVNMKSTGTKVQLVMMIIPGFFGLLSGFLLGKTRRSWLDKSKELDRSARELEKNLETVMAQQVETKNLLRMVNSIPLPVYLKDKDHHYLLANGQYEALSGFKWEDIKGKTDYDIFPEPIADLFREQDLEVVTHQKGKTFEETVPLKDGIITFETFKFPLVDDEGNIYAVGGVCTDITSLKEAEDSLKSQKERLDVVLHQMEEAVIATDCDSRVVMFNKKAAELTENDSAMAIGEMLENLYMPKDTVSGGDIKFWSEIDGKREPRDQEDKEVILRTRTGRAQPVRQKTVVLLDRFGQNMGLLIMFRSTIGTEHPARGLSHLESEDQPAMGQLNDDDLTPSSLNQPIKIMVMDDDRLVRKTCALMLGTKGYETVQARDGEEAISLFRQMHSSDSPISAVIMDLTVPGGMGGLEATAKILEIDPDARIMVASGYSNDPILANFQEYGFVARVEKPFAVQKLIQTVADVLEL